MSDALKHECGIALLDYLNRFYRNTELLSTEYKKCIFMEKQHNRGQDGAGFASIN
jgi:amidophosphoribosyltransferase